MQRLHLISRFENRFDIYIEKRKDGAFIDEYVSTYKLLQTLLNYIPCPEIYDHIIRCIHETRSGFGLSVTKGSGEMKFSPLDKDMNLNHFTRKRDIFYVMTEILSYLILKTGGNVDAAMKEYYDQTNFGRVEIIRKINDLESHIVSLLSSYKNVTSSNTLTMTNEIYVDYAIQISNFTNSGICLQEIVDLDIKESHGPFPLANWIFDEIFFRGLDLHYRSAQNKEQFAKQRIKIYDNAIMNITKERDNQKRSQSAKDAEAQLLRDLDIDEKRKKEKVAKQHEKTLRKKISKRIKSIKLKNDRQNCCYHTDNESKHWKYSFDSPISYDEFRSTHSYWSDF